jgi:hypothetical protein
MFRRYPKTVSILLLLVFTQKAGLRLWMHDWLHETKTAKARTTSENFQLKCDCFDDAMMPLLESPVFVVPAPIRVYATLMASPECPILSAEPVYYSLKGPPANFSRA